MEGIIHSCACRSRHIIKCIRRTSRYNHASSPNVGASVSEQLRNVMRNVPQPVAVIVTRVPEGTNDSSSSKSKYHGSTLSSFTSLTLHPEPLVAFSLRLPSRMADYLRIRHRQSPHTSDPQTKLPTPVETRPFHPRLTVSLLSLPNQHIAEALSKPTLDHSTTFEKDDWDTQDPPGLKDSVGTLSCEVVQSVILRDDYKSGVVSTDSGEGKGKGKNESCSELYICKVLGVIKGTEGGGERPLLHWRQQYISIRGDE